MPFLPGKCTESCVGGWVISMQLYLSPHTYSWVFLHCCSLSRRKIFVEVGVNFIVSRAALQGFNIIMWVFNYFNATYWSPHSHSWAIPSCCRFPRSNITLKYLASRQVHCFSRSFNTSIQTISMQHTISTFTFLNIPSCYRFPRKQNHHWSTWHHINFIVSRWLV